jgi:hypothetical protein
MRIRIRSRMSQIRTKDKEVSAKKLAGIQEERGDKKMHCRFFYAYTVGARKIISKANMSIQCTMYTRD